MSCTVCLNDMCSGGCCNISYSDLQSISYGLRTKIAELGSSYIMRLREGHACKPTDFSFKIGSRTRNEAGISKNGEILIEYKEIKNLLYTLEHEMRSMYMDYKSCICKDTLCKIKDKAIGLLGFNCLDECRKDIKIDSTYEQEWISVNPYCVSREKYEELLYRVCNDLKFELSVVKKSCEMVYTIVQEYKNCDLTYDLIPTAKDCKIEYDTLITTLDCNITFDTFANLRNCGITFRTIADALDCGITFDVDSKNNCPMIVTLEGGYSLCDTEQDQNEQLRNIIRTFSIK